MIVSLFIPVAVHIWQSLWWGGEQCWGSGSGRIRDLVPGHQIRNMDLTLIFYLNMTNTMRFQRPQEKNINLYYI